MAKNKDELLAPVAEAGDLGALLVNLRESVGYSIPQTANAMCLSEETIKRLENEDFENLAEPPYIRGYLRNYAKLAEADSEELITCYESLRGANPDDLNYHFKTSSKILSGKKKSVSPIIMQLLSLVFLLGLIVGIFMIPAVNQWAKSTWESFTAQSSPLSSADTDNPLLMGTLPVPAPLPSDIAIPDKNPIIPSTASEGSTTKAAVDETKKVASTDTKKENESKVESIKVGDKSKEKSEALIPASTDGTINIKLVFSKEVWMRIRDGKKKTVFEGQNKPGQEKTLELKKPLTFRVGNAQGLALFVDGKAVDISSYTNGSIANFTLE